MFFPADFGELCPEGLYRCDDGKCVNPLLRCDGKSDCDDGSDEKGCGESSFF